MTAPLWGQNLQLVADVNQAPAISSFAGFDVPEHLIEFDNKLFFSGQILGAGRELLSFDGTEIQIEADILSNGGSDPTYLTEAGGRLYFLTKNSSSGDMRLMLFDGSNPPVEVDDIKAQYNDNYPRPIAYDGQIYFPAYNDVANNWELRSYGEIGGTLTLSLVASIPGSNNYCPIRGLNVVNNLLYFYGDGQGFMEYDGVNPPSTAPNSSNAFNAVSLTYSVNNDIYFVANDGTSGSELWKYNVVSPPALVADINPGASSAFNINNSNLDVFTVYNGELYFSALDGVNGVELWKTNGSTTTLIDLNPTGGSLPNHLTNFAGNLYFKAFDPTNGIELWSYDGTSAAVVDDLWAGTISSNIQDPIVFQSRLYFGGADGLSTSSLFEYDGTTISRTLPAIETEGSPIRELTRFQNKVYFQAVGPGGAELYATDGITTFMVADLHPGTNSIGQPNSSAPSGFFSYNNTLYFRAVDSNQVNMYEYDGTNPPTISTNLANAASDGFEFNGDWYYRGFDAATGNELWKFDGTNAPTLVSDISPASTSSFPNGFAVFNGKLVFAADDGFNGMELWEYNGVQPSLVANLNPASDAYPEEFTEYNGKLYFRAWADDSIGTELYVYDGVNAPTLVADLYPGSSGGWANESYPFSLKVVNGKLVFVATGPSGNDNLWEYDGVSAPVRITNYVPTGSASNQFASMTVVDGILYFWADAGVSAGSELYRYDGTSAPTMLPELSPGSPRSRAQTPGGMAELDGYVYLNACDWILSGPSTGVGELYRFSTCAAVSASITQAGNLLTADPGFATYQWYNSAGPIPGATAPTYQVTTNETYYCTVTDGNGCSAVSNSIVVLSLSTAAPLDTDLSIYPNPSNGTVFIRSESGAVQGKIYAVTGELVGQFETETVDIGHLSPGVYIFSVETGDLTLRRRVVKY